MTLWLTIATSLFGTTWQVNSAAELVAQASSWQSGDLIQLNAGHYVFSADWLLSKSGTYTFIVNGPVIFDFDTNDWLLTGSGGSAATYYFVGQAQQPLVITGREPGSIWTVGGTSTAICNIKPTSGSATVSFYNAHFDGQYAADRGIYVSQDVSGRTAYCYVYNCTFANTMDDNVAADIEAAGDRSNADPNQKSRLYAYGCIFSNSRYGDGMTGHNFAKAYGYNCVFLGSLSLIPAGPGTNGRVELSGCTLYGNAASISNATVASSNKGIYTLTDCTVYSYFQPVSSGAAAIATPTGATGSETVMSLTRCTVYQYANTSLVHCNVNTTINLTDCNFYHYGDPRKDANVDIKVSGTFVPKRCRFDFQGAVSAGGTDSSPLMQVYSGGLLQANGCLFIRHNLSAIAHIGALIKTGASNSSYIRHCTFIGNDIGDCINLEGTNASPMNIEITGNFIYNWNNGINYTTSQSAGGTYASATTKGYNVFLSMVNKNVPENTAVAGVDGITQATDRPANNTTNTSAVVDLRNKTYGSIDARIVAGNTDASNLDTANAAYQMPSWSLVLNTSGKGTIARDLPDGSDQWPAPNDAGCYVNPQVDVTLTATPTGAWTFSHWYGALTGTTNPDVITLDSNQVIWAKFNKP